MHVPGMRREMRKHTARLARFTLARDFRTNNSVHISLCRRGYREVIAGSYYACKWYFALSWNWHENRIYEHTRRVIISVQCERARESNPFPFPETGQA